MLGYGIVLASSWQMMPAPAVPALFEYSYPTDLAWGLLRRQLLFRNDVAMGCCLAEPYKRGVLGSGYALPFDIQLGQVVHGIRMLLINGLLEPIHSLGNEIHAE